MPARKESPSREDVLRENADRRSPLDDFLFHLRGRRLRKPRPRPGDKKGKGGTS